MSRRLGRAGLLRRADRGVAAVEFAMVAPLFLLMLLGIIVYGLFFVTQIAIVVAASEGARASVAGLTDTERASLARQAAQTVLIGYAPLLTATRASVVAQAATGNATQFQVTVSYPFSAGVAGGLVPLPSSQPSATSSVADGGY